MISRRDLFKLATFSAAASIGFKLQRNLAQKIDQATTVRDFTPSICAMCPAACNIQIEKRNGEVARIHGTENHPINNGKICAKGNAAVDRLYNPNRIKTPLIRTGGERGTWNFRDATWEEASSMVVDKIKEYHDLGHPEYIGVIGGWFPCSYYRPYFKSFLAAIGTPNGTGIPEAACFLAKAMGWKSVFGFGGHPEILTDYENARYVIFMRRNVAGSCSITHAWRYGQNRHKFQTVVMDPRFSETAAKADLWLPVEPGTDLAMLLAMMNVIIKEKLYDREFLMTYSNAPMLLKDGKPYNVWDDDGKKKYMVYDEATGDTVEHDAAKMPALEGEFEVEDGTVIPVFEVIKRRLEDHTPQWAEGITGINASQIENVARDFARYRGVIDSGWHDPKYLNTALTWRAAGLLNSLVGSVNTDGGLLFTGFAQFVSANAPAEEAPAQSALRMWAEDRGIATASFGHTFQAYYDAIINEDPYPVKMMYICGNNFLNNLPDRQKWIEALKKLEFVAVSDILPQDHLYYADVILPESTFLEKDDPLFPIQYAPAFGFHTRVKALEPIHNTRHLIEEMIEISSKLGREDEYFEALSHGIGVNASILKSNYHQEGIKGIRKAQANAKGLDPTEIEMNGSKVTAGRDKIVNTMPYNTPLPTPTGKVEFFSFMLASLATKTTKAYWDPLIKWVPANISEEKLDDDEFYIVYSRAPTTAHSSSEDNPLLAKLIEDSELFYKGLWINSVKASELGIKNGDRIIIESPYTNDRTEGIAFTTGLTRKDTVFTISGFGQQSERLTYNPKGLVEFNRLFPIQYDPLSGCTLCHETTVKIRRA